MREKLKNAAGFLWLPALVGGAAIFYHNAEIILFATLIAMFLVILGAVGWVIFALITGEIP
jgi:hypothetical protein